MTRAGTILLTSDYMQRHTARAIPGASWSQEAGAWVLQNPDARSATIALKLFPALASKHPELVDLRDSSRQQVRPLDYATPFGVEINAPAVRRQLATEGKSLYEFQGIDLGYVAAVAQKHRGAYIGWSRGLGKTTGAIALMDELQARRTLIVAPNTAKDSVWRAEIRRLAPDIDVWVLPNVKNQRERMLSSLIDHTGETPLALVIHYEALAIIAGKKRVLRRAASKKWEPVPPDYKKQDGDVVKTVLGDGWKRYGEWDLVVLDEAHRIKNPRSQQARAAKKICRKVSLALSGSIIENHLEEMFSPLQWLFPINYSSKWRDWNDRYIEYADGDWGRLQLGVKPDRINDLRRELGVFMVYRRKEDELPGFPKKTVEDVYVDLTPEQRRAYDEMRDQFVTQLDSGATIKSSDALSQLNYLRQIATLFDGYSSKISYAIEDILDNSDEEYVIFSWFKDPVRVLAAQLRRVGIEPFVVTGDVKQRARNELIARFMSGEGRIFVGTLATLGESVNLQRASNAFMLDRSYNPALNEQAHDRIYRIGQTRPVTITNLIARDTVDELRMQPILNEKAALRAAVLGG